MGGTEIIGPWRWSSRRVRPGRLWLFDRLCNQSSKRRASLIHGRTLRFEGSARSAGQDRHKLEARQLAS